MRSEYSELVKCGMNFEYKNVKIFYPAHQNNLIQSVENNLTIILVQEWRFFVKSEQSYKFFRFSTKCVWHVF